MLSGERGLTVTKNRKGDQETGSASPWTVIYGAQVEGQEACPSASKTNSGWGYYGGTGVLLFCVRRDIYSNGFFNLSLKLIFQFFFGEAILDPSYSIMLQ